MKTILITGGTRGIGNGLVNFFANKGFNVYFTYKENKEVAESLEKKYDNVFSFQADVRDYKVARDIVQSIINEQGKIDCLVNNAGIKIDKTLPFMNPKGWSDVIETNLNGVFNYSKFVAKQMIQQKYGTIINISSVSGIMGIVGQTNYSTSKAGIIGFTKALARELGPSNVRVNAICPGFIETDLITNLNEEDWKENIILNRFGKVEDLTGVVDFLIGESSSYITGQTLLVDGGLRL